MTGSTIRGLNINQTLIYCLRPSKASEEYIVRCSQYHNAMGESDSDGLSDGDESGEEGDSDESDSDDDVIRVNKDVMEVGEMPKTDKQIRKERRRKLVERNERREAKRRKKSENEFDEVPIEKGDKEVEDKQQNLNEEPEIEN